MKNILHDSCQPRTSLHACEAITKMGWSLLHYPAHSQDLAHSDYRLFGLLKDTVCGHRFPDEDKLKQFLRCALNLRQGILQHWYTVSYSTLANDGHDDNKNSNNKQWHYSPDGRKPPLIRFHSLS
jgi:hypothetical protein